MEYTKKQLEEFSIHDLRVIGRNVGVKAPTAMRKDQLIQAILSIKSGCGKPSFSGRGRPSLRILGDTQKVLPKANKLEQQVDLILDEIKKLIMSLAEK